MSGHTWRELERADMDTAAAHRFDGERRAAMTGTTELLPCPFCGGEAEIHPSNDWDVTFTGSTFFAWCDKCETRGDYYNTEAEAISAWNTRAERTCAMIPSFTKPTMLDDCQEFCCSACGEYMVLQQFPGCIDDAPNYCPNCGAKVVGE